MRWTGPYLAVGTACAVSVSLVEHRVGAAALAVAVGALAVLAIVAGVRRFEPSAPDAWWLLAIAVVTLSVAEAARDYAALADAPAWLRALPGVLRAVGALLAAAAMTLAIRRVAARDWAAWVDTGIVSVALASVTFLVVLDPLLGLGAGPRRDAAIASVAASVVLAAAATRFAFVAGSRRAVFVIGAGATALCVAASFVSARLLVDGFLPPHRAGLLALLAVVAYGATALVPSMVRLTQPVEAPLARLGGLRVVIVVVSVLVTLFSMAAAVRLSPADAALRVTIVAAVLVGLLIARTVTMVHDYEQAGHREHVLRAGAAALVAAQTRDDIRKTASDTATALAGGVDSAFVDVSFGARPTITAEDAVVVGGGDVGTWMTGELRRQGRLGRAGTSKTIVVPLVVQAKLAGVVRVTGRRPLTQDLHQALQTLASQVEQSLESAALADDLLARQSEARFRSLVQNSRDLIAVVERDLTVRYATPSVETMLGHPAPELIGTKLDDLLHPDEREDVTGLLLGGGDARSEVEFQLRHDDGRWRTVEAVVGNLLDDPAVQGIVLTAHDVTERRELEDQLVHQAFHDALTGLPNRALFADRVRHALNRSARSGHAVAVLFVDIDDFKTVNDSLGHTAGDELLMAVAERLGHATRTSDTAARLGGDEFAVLLEETNGVNGAVVAAERFLALLTEPFVIGGTQLFVRASVGIVLGSSDVSAVELLRNADVAMYKAKSQGGNRFEVFDPEMHAAALHRLQLKADLERALQTDELHLEYQPIVRLTDGAIVGLEALLRWRHPERGPVSPVEFVPLAEETGLIIAIGEWVLRTAAAQAVTWRRSLPASAALSLSVNVSGRQLQTPELVGTVERIVRETGITPADLVLELTESSLMDDVDVVVARLRELKRLGVRIAVDDFGTGFSSLGYLEQFPVDILKVAKPFVDGVHEDRRKAGLAQAVVNLARSLELRTVAEGIELDEQRRRLVELGCDLGQGYLFARPLPVAAVPAALGISVAA